MVHHRIHAAGRDPEEQPGPAELAKVAQVVPPVWLRQDRHAQAFVFDGAADDRSAEGRMVDVGVAGHEDDVDLVPTAGLQLVARGGQPAGGFIAIGHNPSR